MRLQMEKPQICVPSEQSKSTFYAVTIMTSIKTKFNKWASIVTIKLYFKFKTKLVGNLPICIISLTHRPLQKQTDRKVNGQHTGFQPSCYRCKTKVFNLYLFYSLINSN